MFIHGGYWRALSCKEFSFVAGGLVPHDITVGVMNYGLCPQVTIADITRQSHRGRRVPREECESLGR